MVSKTFVNRERGKEIFENVSFSLNSHRFPWGQNVSCINFHNNYSHVTQIYLLSPALGGSRIGTMDVAVIFSVKSGSTSSTRPAVNSQFVISFFSALTLASSTFCSKHSIPYTCLHFWKNIKNIAEVYKLYALDFFLLTEVLRHTWFTCKTIEINDHSVNIWMCGQHNVLPLNHG